MEVAHDVIIIGAGPAGSTLAALLASRGVSVALVDRDEFPRDKLCGEFVSYDALPILETIGVSDRIAGGARIQRCHIVTSRVYEFELPSAAIGISRMRFDDLLLRAAIDRGATAYTGWTATRLDAAVGAPANPGSVCHSEPRRRRGISSDWRSSFNVGDPSPSSRLGMTAEAVIAARTSAPGVFIEREGVTQHLRGTVVIGAWGRWGRFDTQLGRPFARVRSNRSFGFKRHYRGGSTPRDVIELYSFRGGYLGVNAIEEELTNICGLVSQARIEHLTGRWPAFIDAIRGERPEIDRMYASHQPAQEGFLSSEPVVFRARAPVDSNVLMIGDASGIVDPLAGNGIAMAMQSALLAAPFVLRIIGASSDRNGIERSYSAAHQRLFAPRIRWSRRAAHLLSNPTMLDTGVRRLRAPSVGRFLLRRTRASTEQIERLIAAWV